MARARTLGPGSGLGGGVFFGGFRVAEVPGCGPGPVAVFSKNQPFLDVEPGKWGDGNMHAIEDHAITRHATAVAYPVATVPSVRAAVWDTVDAGLRCSAGGCSSA